MDILAAVVTDKGGKFDVRPLKLEAPRDDEILVKIVATGLCHTDIAVRDRLSPAPVPMPVVLGHEGAGIVEQVGANVENFKIGDKVILSLGYCGQCEHCAEGLQTYCDHHFEYNWRAERADGSVALRDGDKPVHSHFFGQSSFANYAVVTPSSAIKVDNDVPLEYLGPFACGVMTGAGAVMNTLNPTPGSTMAIFGIGAVGLSAVMMAKVMGCTKIVAIDIHDNRLALAKTMGATDVINAGSEDVLARIKSITNGCGVEYSVEAAGNLKVMATAESVLAEGGKCVLVGAVKPGSTLSLDVMHLIRGRTVQGSIMGDATPSVFLPKLVELFKQGQFPVDKMIRFYELEDINQAVADALEGQVIKGVIKMPH